MNSPETSRSSETSRSAETRSAEAPRAHEIVIPQTLEGEQSVLGACLLDAGALAKALEMLREIDFYRELHRKIWRVMHDLAALGEPIDIMTMSMELSRLNQLDEIGGVAYLSALIDACPSSANVESYARGVKDKSLLRQLLGVSETLRSEALGVVENVGELLDRAEKMVFEVARDETSEGAVPMCDLFREVWLDIEHQFRRKGEIDGIPTGLRDLDRTIAGLHENDFIVIGGRPGMGKTACVNQILTSVARHTGRPCLMFSLEMSKKELIKRAIFTEARINNQALRQGWGDLDAMEKIGQSFMKFMSEGSVPGIKGLPYLIDDTKGLSALEILGRARRYAARYGPPAVIAIDYLQIVEALRGKRPETRAQELGEASRIFKRMAGELKTTVIALSQLSRAVEQREDKRPVMSDLRESGSIEAEADVIMFLYRPAYYKRPDDILPDEENICEYLIEKQRNGPRSVVRVHFDSSCGWFSDLAHSWDNEQANNQWGGDGDTYRGGNDQGGNDQGGNGYASGGYIGGEGNRTYYDTPQGV